MFRLNFQESIDVKPLLREVARANRKALSESGKEVKREAKALVKRRKGTRGRNKAGRFTRARGGGSKPGEPPSRVSGDLHRSIKYETGRTIVLVGATRPLGSHGSILTWGRKVTSKTGELRERPFMAPALERVRGRLPEKWRNRL